MGDLGWVGDLVTRLGQPAENVWLVALGLARVTDTPPVRYIYEPRWTGLK